jgi:hypothetical protein
VSLAEQLARLRDLAARGSDARTNLVLAGLVNLIEDLFGELDALRMELVRHLATQHEPPRGEEER